MVHQNVVVNEDLFQKFQAFWAVSWVVIVKGWHAVEFALLLVLCVGAMNRFRGAYARRNILYAVSLCLAYAVSDEWHQVYVPGRDGTVGDVLIDSFGVLVAGLWLHGRRAYGRGAV